jgi:DNA polymerase III epsilon subunit-like protein
MVMIFQTEKEKTSRKNFITTQFKRWLDEDCIVLDTETTGLGKDDEVIEISMMTASGTVLLDTLIKPLKPIPDEATSIHGITNDMVANAPTWADIHDEFTQLLKGRTVVIYNSSYDMNLIHQSASKYQLTDEQFADLGLAFKGITMCAMKAYAQFYGEWDDYRGKYRWQRLTYAAAQQGVAIDGKAHRALCDVKTTLGIIRAVVAGGRAIDDQ